MKSLPTISTLAMALALQQTYAMAGNAPGDLDFGFGTNGVVLTNMSSGDDGIAGMVVQPDGKIVVAGQTWNGTDYDFALARYIPDGTLDPSFGSGKGWVSTAIGSGRDSADAIALQPDGKIIVAGSAWDGTYEDFALVRYNPDGTLDTTFDDTGIVQTNAATGDANPSLSVIVHNGKIIVAGSIKANRTTGENYLALLRYDEDGRPDTSLGGSGQETLDLRNTDDAFDVAVQNDGKILVTGRSNLNGRYDMVVLRFLENGSLDPAFNGSGLRFIDWNGENDEAFGIAVQEDGKIVIAGETTINQKTNFALARIDPDGALDVSFNSVGKVVTQFTGDAWAKSVCVLSDGTNRIVVAGQSTNTAYPGGEITLARYSPNGALDTSFGSEGKFSIPVGSRSYPTAVSIQNDGKPLVAGGTTRVANTDFLLARLGVNGGLDGTFNQSGIVTLDFESQGPSDASSIVAENDGKIIVVGTASNGHNTDFAVARFLPDGTLDRSFNGSGKATCNFGSNETCSGCALQSDGKIVLAGTTVSGSNHFAMARFNSDGSLDPTFGPDGTGQIIIPEFASTATASGVAIQPDGKILVTGTAAGNGFGESDMIVVRLNPDGTVDQSFGRAGMAQTEFSGRQDLASAIAVQTNGTIIVAGREAELGFWRIGIARFNTLGTSIGNAVLGGFEGRAVAVAPDQSFVVAGQNLQSNSDFSVARYTASGGYITHTTTAFSLGSDEAYAVAVQNDGMVVVAGQARNVSLESNEIAIARFNSDLTLDPGFSSDGRVTTKVGSGSTAKAMAIQSDGKIIVAGWAQTGKFNSFMVTRYFGTPQPPAVVTGAATGITKYSATLSGTVNPNSLATTVHFEYGPDITYGSVTPEQLLPNVVTPLTVYANLDNAMPRLEPNRLYHFRVVAESSAGVRYGADQTFTTDPDPPLAFTGEAAQVTSTGATLTGAVVPLGRQGWYQFEYGPTTAYGRFAPEAATVVPGINGVVNVSAMVVGLNPDTPYHFRLIAGNGVSAVPAKGEDRTFVARTPPPVVTVGAAIALSTTRAKVEGVVNAQGAPTTVTIEYAPVDPEHPEESNFRSEPAIQNTVSGTEDTAVSAILSNLTQGTTYRYRLKAANAGGLVTSAPPDPRFTLSILSGLSQVFPDTPPHANGAVQINLAPAGTGGWRFAGEQQWWRAGETANHLATGDRIVEFRPVPGYNQPPQEIVSVVSGEPLLVMTRYYYRSPVPGSGGLCVAIKPDSIAAQAGWRLTGESDWRPSGETVTERTPGTYLVECRPVAGRTTPAPAAVGVTGGQPALLTLTYFLAETQSGVEPTVLTFQQVSTNEDMPYAFAGQLRSNNGAGSGFVVKRRVVATAAHMVWDDGTLSASTGLQWLFQRDRGTYEPRPQIPRGFYMSSGYSAQRQSENSPGNSLPPSQELDYAVLYFADEAGRGGSGGFLASDSATNEFLDSSLEKVLVGYPVDGFAAANAGRMHATPPNTAPFVHAFGKTYATDALHSSGGNSGGPLCVRHTNGKFYPAAIYLGGSAQVVVRAIDGAVVDLISRAEVSANGGSNNTGGGITHTSVATFGTTDQPGALVVTIEPPEAAGTPSTPMARWRLKGPDSPLSWRASGNTQSSLTAGTYVLELTTVSGFQDPAPQTVMINGGQVTALTFTYAAGQSPLEAWRLAHFGRTANTDNAADTADPDGDGYTNIEEYAAFTDPNSGASGFRAVSIADAAGLHIRFSAKAGRSYRLEFSSTLNETWQTLQTRSPAGTDAEVDWLVNSVAQVRRFYRVVAEVP